jgi:hypothetical protein
MAKNISSPSPVLEPRSDAHNRLCWKLAILFAFLRTAYCVYRGVHQSIVHDEALTFLNYSSRGFSAGYLTYDANNHILYTLLTTASVQAWGASELSLRLPSLLAGAGIVLATYSLLQPLVPAVLALCVTLVIGLHPLLLDFSVAARGYSLALFLLLLGWNFSFRYRTHLAGLCFGLAASSNLVVVFPILAWLLSSLVFGPELFRARFRQVRQILFAAIPVFSVISFPALRHASVSRHFYFGADTFAESYTSLLQTSFFSRPLQLGLLANSTVATLVALAALPAVIFVCLRSLWLVRTLRLPKHLALLPGATLLSLAALITAHGLFGLPYPADRTGLYFFLLVPFAWIIAVALEPSRWTRAALSAVLGLAAVQFTTQLQHDAFAAWWYDAETKVVALRLARLTTNAPPSTIRVSANWLYQPALEFYRISLPLTALQPIRRNTPTILENHDYYVLASTDATATLLPIYEDRPHGIRLAESQPGLHKNSGTK